MSKEIRCGESFPILICVSCGNEDFSVERGLCAYCTVVHPERLDTIQCKGCETFKPESGFATEDGLVKRPMCFDCESYWDLAYEETQAKMQSEMRQFAYAN